MKNLPLKSAIKKLFLLCLVLLITAAAWLYLNDESTRRLKQEAEIRAMDLIGKAAAKRIGGEDGQVTHGSAVELIKRPVEIRRVTDNIHYATGVGNTVMITTADGAVVFDTGLVIQSASQLRLLKETVSSGPVRYIILSHSHADHIGGTRFWAEKDTQIVTHSQFEEEQRYLSELEPYQYDRNRILFPWMPSWEERPALKIMRYGGIKPTRTVENWKTYSFELGHTQFQVIGAPGAEGADNIVMWLPQQKVLISGDFFGPQFPQFPNIFTMRGEKVRKPVEYIKSLNMLIELEPEIIIPGHLDPTVGAAQIRAGMERIRDAVQFVHDETIAGMNAGKSVEELMLQIQLPPHLELAQNHGRVDWAVRSIWDYYMGWFRFESTTELYPVPAREVYADLAATAGSESLLALSRNYLSRGEPVKALHIVEVVTASEPRNKTALSQRIEALELLLQRAKEGTRNDYEIYWLKNQLDRTNHMKIEVFPGGNE